LKQSGRGRKSVHPIHHLKGKEYAGAVFACPEHIQTTIRGRKTTFRKTLRFDLITKRRQFPGTVSVYCPSCNRSTSGRDDDGGGDDDDGGQLARALPHW
jgi:hypothetical protein